MIKKFWCKLSWRFFLWRISKDEINWGLIPKLSTAEWGDAMKRLAVLMKEAENG